MDIIWLDWLQLAVRWIHIITGIAWIGSSFYFMWHDYHLEPPKEGSPEGVHGELWTVHGGGFYHNQKYLSKPAEMPKNLHWFKWESYFTWISGFFLMVILYYWGAEIYLIDSEKFAAEPWQAITLGLGVLFLGWIVYDLLCRTPLGKNDSVFLILGFVLILVLAYGLNLVFSGRGMFIHIGALLATIMTANVFMVIIPNQKKVVKALVAGDAIDPKLGKQSKQRSTHNNYLTLPVLFAMISNHYPITYAHPYNWAILGGIFVSAVMVRHFFNLRNQSIEKRIFWLPGAFIVFLATIFGAHFSNLPQKNNNVSNVSFQEIRGVIERRCVACHADQPTFPGFVEAPQGLSFNSDETIRNNAQQIFTQVVQTKAMPIGNLTKITEEERQNINDWYMSLQK